MLLNRTLDRALIKGGCCNGRDVDEDPLQTRPPLYTRIDVYLRYSTLKHSAACERR